jgi:Na+-transporting methylmalonyl-CoA/oxaloacetate decarboxylase gamma subunit
MDSMTILQVSENVIRKSAEMADKDPHGLIITLVSVSVVFAALILLYFAYTLIGMSTNGRISLKRREHKNEAEKPTDEVAAAIAMALDQELNGEVYAAIGLALHQHLNDSVHDEESYIITIRRQEYERI